MGDSDGFWGELQEHDDDRAAVWDGCGAIPDPGDNHALDAFVATKRISHAALVRIGARMAEHTVLCFAGPRYLKFRDVVTDRRWSYADSDWSRMRVVRHGPEPSSTVIVVEGESDAARCCDAFACDVAVMPAGARYFPDSYAEQLGSYELVLAATDTDTAGEAGAQKIIDALPTAQRFAPPANDWCSTADEDLPQLPSPEDFEPRVEMKVLVPAGELLDLEPPDMITWYEQAVLPVAGQMILHGWAKSFKSYIAYDLLAALSQGLDWCCFEPTEEPCRVGVMQYEIPWAFYQQRVRQLREKATRPELFDTNFLTFTPMRRPTFIAGNTKQEDAILAALEDAQVQVFLLDPVRRATGNADLNSEKEVRPLLSFFARLQDNGITVVSCHHDNKSASRQGGGDPLGMTGVGAFAGDADTIVSVSIPKGLSVEQPMRNLHFTTRNAPSISARGMRMGEDSQIVYSTSTYGAEDEGAHQSSASDEPSI